jgi:hypothetical protein
MHEVHAYQQKAKVTNRAASARLALSSIISNTHMLPPQTIESTACLFFFKARGMYLIRAPSIEKRVFFLDNMVANWHTWLKGISQSHVAWTNRAPYPPIEFDDDPDRFILVGGVFGKEDPGTSKFDPDDSGTVRDFFDYVFPKISDPSPQTSRRQSGPKATVDARINRIAEKLQRNCNWARSAYLTGAQLVPITMRQLALVIPTKEVYLEEETLTGNRIKREYVSL